MDHIEKLYAQRNAVSKDLIKKVFDGDLGDGFPFIINNANYFVLAKNRN